MPKKGPILIIEDDRDDQELLQEVFDELKITNEIKFFSSCLAVLDYLLTALIKPFMIISDINIPLMTGLQLKQKINETENLIKKNIPFIFLTTNPDQTTIVQAFYLNAQGYFVKPSTLHDIRDMLRKIIDYWSLSMLPV